LLEVVEMCRQITIQFTGKYTNNDRFILGGALKKILLSLYLYRTVVKSLKHTHTHTHSLSPTEAPGARRRQSGLMKYSSLEFKDSKVGPVKGSPRDGDVSRIFMTWSHFSPFLSCSFDEKAAGVLGGGSRCKFHLKQAVKLFQ